LAPILLKASCPQQPSIGWAGERPARSLHLPSRERRLTIADLRNGGVQPALLLDRALAGNPSLPRQHELLEIAGEQIRRMTILPREREQRFDEETCPRAGGNVGWQLD